MIRAPAIQKKKPYSLENRRGGACGVNSRYNEAIKEKGDAR